MNTKHGLLYWRVFSPPAIFRYKLAILAMGMISCLPVSPAQAQMQLLSDNRNLSAGADVSNPGDPVISYTGDYSATATPTAPFANFSSSLSGQATMVWSATPQITETQSGYANADQDSSIAANQIFYTSVESGYGTGNLGQGQGSSSMTVSFCVISSAVFNITIDGLGDPLGSSSDFILSSVDQGILDTATTDSLVQEGMYGVNVYYSGTLNPGDVYTLMVTSNGGGTGQNGNGGGFSLDLNVTSVPEPSLMACGTESLAALVVLVGFARRENIKS
ncbi:MAG: hypothetical protein ABSF34_10090 [Verrucomicrobiota bacterium]|jgi:hypothetical protein